MTECLIAPSTDPCALDKLNDYVSDLLDCGADWIHCDVMDGVFVEKRNFEPKNLTLLSPLKTFFDVHLMVANPMDVIDDYINAGANSISVHREAFTCIETLFEVILYIKSKGVRAGVALNPATEVDSIVNILPKVDMVLVMSVVPGKSGQAFMPSILPKIEFLNKVRKEKGYDFFIEVDGGINENTIRYVKSAGVDVAVVGSAMYKAEDKKSFIQKLKSL